MMEVTTEVRDPSNAPPEEVALYMGAILWRNLDDGRVIVLYDMIFNVRICIGQQMDGGYSRGWCYPKNRSTDAIMAVVMWDGNGDPPDGWIKEVGTGRRRVDGDPAQEYFAE